jgi:hypothetical protein
MGLFSKISKAFKKVVKVSTGGLIGGHHNSGQSTTEAAVPAPELGFVNADTTNTTEAESEKQQLTKGKKRGKKSLKIDMTGAGGTGRNIV